MLIDFYLWRATLCKVLFDSIVKRKILLCFPVKLLNLIFDVRFDQEDLTAVPTLLCTASSSAKTGNGAKCRVVGLGLAHYLRKEYLKSFLLLVWDSALWLKLSSAVPAENIYEIGVINFRAYFTNSLTLIAVVLIEVWWFSSQWQLMILFNTQKWRTKYFWQKYWIF